MKKVFVRADGNEQIGMGHLMRTLTIMDQMDHSEAEITYLCATDQGADLVSQKGYKAELLTSDYQRMEDEVSLLKPVLKKAADLSGTEPLILVDSYYVTDYYLQFLSGYGTVVLLDDGMQRVFPVDGVINYNAFAQEEWYSEHYPQKKRWIGPLYAPLREEFNNTPKADPSVGNEILITTGGGDQRGIGMQILKMLYSKEYVFHLVLGNFGKASEAFLEFAEDKPNIMIHNAVQNMAELMGRCILGITAGGSTVYEMCAMGLPMIVFSYAENQEKLAEFIGSKEAGFHAGAYHLKPEQCLNEIRKGFIKATLEPEVRLNWRESAMRLVDGQGAGRLANALLNDCNSTGNVLR